MGITVELVGERSQEVEAEAGCYSDLLSPFDVSKHEVSIFVDGRPVPEDEQIDPSVDHVRVLRLIKGG
ncbi:sulfur carrier protein [Halovenus aranensis]|jgi:sulfur carrier protein|uniref:Sulfur carrier protein n=1 Tax=Halovenus aranensis TaxID=890420 RepID=A0A1G8UBN2_9EURY|nr:ubiquitin-like small modifier protein 2 [Halovenus aranensis]SDJ51151.1 sulfur carrier protein [Halovenus aranensis]